MWGQLVRSAAALAALFFLAKLSARPLALAQRNPDMIFYHGLAYVFGGLFLANSIPHLASGMMGRAFQSPFAKPSGEGLSSSTVNALWGWLNLGIGYLLICQVGDFDPRNLTHVGLAAIPAALISLWMAHHFGRFHGGNTPLSGEGSR